MKKRFLEQEFLQSLEWEKFLRALKKSIFRVEKNLFVVENLPLGFRYAYSPRGPKTSSQFIGDGKQWMQEILQEAKKQGCDWIRVEPGSEEELLELQQNIQHSTFNIPISWRKAPRDIQPREILVMGINPSEEELLANMKSKTRYNIRLAEKKGVEVITSNDKQYRDRFFELVRETAERAGIRAHERNHYEKLLDALGPEKAILYSAHYKGKVIAVNLMIFYDDLALYLHGGSGNAYRNVMAPFLLQWRAIQDAKKKECRWYDFGGVSTPQKTEHEIRNVEHQEVSKREKTDKKEWEGITRFKQGFCPGTESISFPGTYDIVLSEWKYRVYRGIRKITSLKNSMN
jgi:lipid II:glycine glycyltransferase (peptidoglycan interpeptide bridge formation enzyme)